MQVLAHMGRGAPSTSPLQVPALCHPGGSAGPLPRASSPGSSPSIQQAIGTFAHLSPSTRACTQLLLCDAQHPELPPAGCRDQQPCFLFPLQTRVPESHCVQPPGHLLLRSRGGTVPPPRPAQCPSVSILPCFMFSLESISSAPVRFPGHRGDACRALPRAFRAWKCHLTPFGLQIS